MINSKKAGLFWCLMIGFLANIRGEGLRIYQPSAESQMRAEAVVASGSDAGVAWHNPAMLTTLGKGDVSFNFDNLILKSKYTDPSGVVEKSNKTYFPLPSLYFGQKIGQTPWAIGLSINTPFGLSTEYSKTSAFRYITTGGEVQVLGINPSAAYALTPKLSVALGASYFYSTAELNQQVPGAAVSPFLAGMDLQGKVKGHGDGYGMNAAMFLQLSAEDTLGVSYRSQVVVKYSGGDSTISIPGGANVVQGSAKTSIRYPDTINLGFAHHFSKGLVEVGGGWTNYTDAKQVVVQASGQPDNVTNLYWKNSGSLRIGGEYWLRNNYSLSGGYEYILSPTRESTYTPLVPDGNHHMFCSGLTNKRGNLTLRLPLVVFIQTGRSNVDSKVADSFGAGQNVDGKYNLTGYEIGLGASYRFGG
ncbi:MAG: outer membrane protein transport protein [Elusimicrobia bacterium]|nr:outer membrane protein transport protein [Elusimicrobiota bacterium]